MADPQQGSHVTARDRPWRFNLAQLPGGTTSRVDRGGVPPTPTASAQGTSR